jgi:creatine kinase
MSTETYPPTGLAPQIKELPEWIQKGCGSEEYYCEEKGATFLGGKMPEECPDLSKHTSFFADAMKANPEIYKELKDKKTKLGVTLGHCIKTGIDNPGKKYDNFSSKSFFLNQFFL